MIQSSRNQVMMFGIFLCTHNSGIARDHGHQDVPGTDFAARRPKVERQLQIGGRVSGIGHM
jgi:hypothetical protein